MKRMIIALILLVASVAASAAEIRCVSDSADSFLGKIELSDSYVRRNELDKALRLCRELDESWDDISQKIDVLLIHDYVDNISVSFAQMRSHLESGNADMYFAESAGAKKGLASIKGSEYPNLENIL